MIGMDDIFADDRQRTPDATSAHYQIR